MGPKRGNKRRNEAKLGESLVDECQGVLDGFKSTVTKTPKDVYKHESKLLRDSGGSKSNLKSDPCPEPTDNSSSILAGFDLNCHYGPCSGITRRERLERAKALGLEVDWNTENIVVINNKLMSESVIDQLMKNRVS